jgi:hypothetical protein
MYRFAVAVAAAFVAFAWGTAAAIAVVPTPTPTPSPDRDWGGEPRPTAPGAAVAAHHGSVWTLVLAVIVIGAVLTIFGAVRAGRRRSTRFAPARSH